jgi:Rnl2 family RNA ligase
MKFLKFPSLINSYQDKIVNQVQMLGITDWTLTEKIHGANMGLYCDGTIVRPASRNALVDGTFFKCEPVINKYTESIEHLYKVLNSPDYIIVYGEYFGGLYEGKSEVHAKKVQKGIDYTPDNDFMAFNVLAINNGIHTWVDTASLKILLGNLPLKTVPILHTGSLSSCLNYDHEYNTTIPASYGLQEQEVNVCEGNVIMPSSGSDYMGNDGKFRGFKHKNSLWSEKSAAPKEEFVVSAELDAQLNELLLYATDNRFQNVLSKEGEFNPKMIGKYIGLMLKDIYEEYLVEDNLLPEAKLNKKYLTVRLTQAVRNIILKQME